MMTETLDVMGAEMIVRRNDGMFIAEHPVPPGYFVPPHRHDHDEETLLVMDGELTLIGEGGETKAGPGACRTFERGQLHGYRNDTDGTAKMVVIASPGVQLAEMFRHFDRAARKGPLTPPDVMAIAAEYGVTFG